MTLAAFPLKYFKPSEFRHPERLSPYLLALLDTTREIAGVPIYISSDFRPGDPLSHGRGLAVDIVDDRRSDGITSAWRFLITGAAIAAGFKRIGVYDGHIHLDVDESLPQGRLWVGVSK